MKFENQDIDEIDLGRLLRLIFLQSKFIIFITIIGIFLGITYFTTSTKTYKISSMLQIYDNASSGITGSSLDLFGSTATDINLLVNLYKTRSNIIQIIDEFQLNVFTDYDGLALNSININNDELQNFYIKLKSDKYDLYDSSNILILSGEYNLDYLVNGIEINVDKSSVISDELIEITYLKPEDLYLSLYRGLNIDVIESTKFNASGGFFRVSYITDDIEKGKKIVNFANNLFVNDIKKSETEEARKAIEFIDNQLLSLSSILEVKKQNLKNFKKDNQSINVDLEIQSIIESIANIEENLNIIDIDLAEASSIYTQSNPLIQTIKNRKEILMQQKEEIESRIRNLPFAEQKYIDLYRDVEISRELFTELTNRKLGYSILEASTLGNIRIVDLAYNESLVSPSFIYTIIIAFMFFIFALIAALIRGNYFLAISNPAEINDIGINAKIYGVVPYRDDKVDTDDINFQRAIESTIVNFKTSLNLESKTASVILITSPSENNGKSLISRSISKRLASMGEKTLLIDSDLIKGDQNKFFDTKKISPEDFLSLDDSNIDLYKKDENLYLIPKISQLNDTFNFVYNERYKLKIDYLKTIFDYIIIDTAPVLSVTDTSILMGYSDLNFLIVHHNLTKPNQIKQTVYMSEQMSTEYDGLIYNAYKKPKSYYGYYNVYGDYRYQYYADKYLYNYQYQNEKDE